MAAKTKQPPLHIALGYSGLSDSAVAAEALAAHDGIKAHPEFFPNPPDLNAFLATIQAFEGSIAAAKDGGRKAISQKKKDRAATMKALRQLGHYVEANCKDAAGSLSGQIVVKGKPIPRARSYVFRYAPAGPDGKPGTWTEIALTNPRAIQLTGLTPGTTYTLQIRALGVLGFGEWSDVATRMSL